MKLEDQQYYQTAGEVREFECAASMEPHTESKGPPAESMEPYDAGNVDEAFVERTSDVADAELTYIVDDCYQD